MVNANQELNIHVTFRHTEPTEALRTYAMEKVSHCLNKYLKGFGDVQIILSVEKRDQQAEVKVKSKDYDLVAKAMTTDLYSAIDKVIDSIEVQVRKKKERLKERLHEHRHEEQSEY